MVRFLFLLQLNAYPLLFIWLNRMMNANHECEHFSGTLFSTHANNASMQGLAFNIWFYSFMLSPHLHSLLSLRTIPIIGVGRLEGTFMLNFHHRFTYVIPLVSAVFLKGARSVCDGHAGLRYSRLSLGSSLSLRVLLENWLYFT